MACAATAWAGAAGVAGIYLENDGLEGGFVDGGEQRLFERVANFLGGAAAVGGPRCEYVAGDVVGFFPPAFALSGDFFFAALSELLALVVFKLLMRVLC